MDSQLRRVYLTAAGILLAAVATSLLWRSRAVTIGVAAGVLIAVFPFVTWQLVVQGAAKPGRIRRAVVVGVILVKYGVLAGGIWGLTRSGLADLGALAAGVVVGSLAVLGAGVGGAKR